MPGQGAMRQADTLRSAAATCPGRQTENNTSIGAAIPIKHHCITRSEQDRQSRLCTLTTGRRRRAPACLLCTDLAYTLQQTVTRQNH